MVHAPRDVVVVGGGNAALVAAMSARDRGARVLILERSDVVSRGGNSRHTRNIRCIHGEDTPWNTGSYTRDELWSDLCGVGEGPSDERLAALTVDATKTVPAWMVEHGARFQRPLEGTLHLGRTNTFFLGGGKALINSYYSYAQRSGIEILYDARVEAMEFAGDRCTAVIAVIGGVRERIECRAVVVAAGGFEANLEWLGRYWGDAASNYHIRGPATNDGLMLAALLEAGAARAGEERGFHSVAVDARSPRFDGGIATRIDSIPFGVVLNRDGARFYDEGEDIWPKRYAIWGRNIALQPDQIAYAIWDSKVQELFLPPMYGAQSADSLEDLTSQLGLSGTRALESIAEFNQGVPEDAATRFDPSKLDGVGTAGVSPPKSNWALRVDQPPYFGIAMRPGITFTYLGVGVDAEAAIRRQDGSTFANVFAAGEIMSGNVLSTGYLAGFGMAIGTVWGHIAGRSAAAHGSH